MDETDEKKLAELDCYLSKESRNHSYYDLLASLSNKLQRSVSGIVKVLEFDRSSSSKEILVAIDYFKANDGNGLVLYSALRRIQSLSPQILLRIYLRMRILSTIIAADSAEIKNVYMGETRLAGIYLG